MDDLCRENRSVSYLFEIVPAIFHRNELDRQPDPAIGLSHARRLTKRVEG